jgi:hypothetical protein
MREIGRQFKLIDGDHRSQLTPGEFQMTKEAPMPEIRINYLGGARLGLAIRVLSFLWHSTLNLCPCRAGVQADAQFSRLPISG